MKTGMMAFFLAGLAVFACGQSLDSIEEPDVVTYSGTVDRVVLGALESLRKMLTNLTIDDVSETFSNENVNVSFSLLNTNLKGAPNFERTILKTTLFPIEIKNLTLLWKEVSVETDYAFEGRVDFDELQGVTDVHGKGRGRMVLKNVRLTAGAKFEIVNSKIQIQPKGLYGVKLNVGEANVVLESIMGSPETGKLVGSFLSNAIPGFVDAVQQPLITMFYDGIVKLLNAFLGK